MAAKHAQPVINASNHPPRKHSPARRSPKDTICWYHAKFGNKAKACRPPCLFSSSAKHCLSNSGNDQASTYWHRSLAKTRAVYFMCGTARLGTSSLSILELRSAFFRPPPMIAVGKRQNPQSLLMAPGLTPLGRDAYRLTWDFVSSTGILFLLMYIAQCQAQISSAVTISLLMYTLDTQSTLKHMRVYLLSITQH